MKSYEAPTITELGSVLDVTRGSVAGNNGDGNSFRGPEFTPTPTS